MGHDVTSPTKSTLSSDSETLKEIERSAERRLVGLPGMRRREEDARERFELAREQLQLAGTKVAIPYNSSRKQIRESVRGLKAGVVEAERLIAEVIATPTLSAAEEATLLSSRAAFAELQQEMARNL
ncbi:hypothetical protein H6P81_018436 [Aristolochia fimbriata]|uniref:Tubulin-specific chaperone A n=1 Tax=Aristolochia fimbriata TaxID=158543 RepID=A0AAV7E1E8_ARIFI|nr:hypothetical protein H6P81_018436 [Aristolochia fimbriata]